MASRRMWGWCVGAMLACIAYGRPVHAQAVDQPALPLSRFTPSFAGDRFFNTPSPYAAGNLDVHAQVMGDYSHGAFVLRNGETDEVFGSVVEHQLLMHLDATVALARRLALNISFPFALAQAGDDPAGLASPSGAEVGDLRVGLRASLLGTPDGFFQLGMGAHVWLPTAPAGRGSFLGNGSVRAMPHLMASGVAKRFVWGLSAGIEFRKTQEVLGVGQGSLLSLRLANGVLLGSEDQVQLSMEIAGALVPVDISERTTNGEVLAGIKWRFIDDFIVGAAAGPGVFSAVGTPDVRAVLSFAFSPLQDMGVLQAARAPD